MKNKLTILTLALAAAFFGVVLWANLELPKELIKALLVVVLILSFKGVKKSSKAPQR